MIGVRVSITARAPSASPAMTLTVTAPSALAAVGMWPDGISW
jgi:hypothetical protein